MGTKLFKESKIGNTFIREFNGQFLTEQDLKWHQDNERRIIKPLHETDWKIQLDNQLPITLSPNKEIVIERHQWHRLIKGESKTLKLSVIKEEKGNLNESVNVATANEIIDKLKEQSKDKNLIKTYELLGSGTAGVAYNVNGKVFKVTDDPYEYSNAIKVKGKKNNNLQNIYEALAINYKGKQYYIIIGELLIMDNTKTKDMLEKLSDFLDTEVDYSLSYFLNDVYEKNIDRSELNRIIYKAKKNPEVYKILVDLLNIINQLHNNKIDSFDLTSKNLGFKPNGKLTYFDFGYGTDDYLSPKDVIELNEKAEFTENSDGDIETKIYRIVFSTPNTTDIHDYYANLDYAKADFNNINRSDYETNYDTFDVLLEELSATYEPQFDSSEQSLAEFLEDYPFEKFFKHERHYILKDSEFIDTIDSKEIKSINNSTDQMIEQLQEFINKKYIGKRFGEKYMTLWVEDKNGDQKEYITIRVADHSQNPMNKKGMYNLSFVIANKNATRDRFHSKNEYYYDDTDDIEYIKSDVESIIDDMIETIKEDNDLNENSVISEAMVSFNDLEESTGLYVRKLPNAFNITLYNHIYDEVYATIGLVRSRHSKDFYVVNVASEKGYGPLIYEIAMMLVSPLGVRPSESGLINGQAINVWSKFFDRQDIKKETLKSDDTRYVDEFEKDFDLEDQKNLKFVTTMNTIYYLEPNNILKNLINVGKNATIEDNIDPEEVHEKGEDMWNMKYH